MAKEASNKNYNIIKATIWYVISNILVKGVSFFVLPIFTNLMTTEEYGIYNIYVSYLAIAEVIILFGLSSTIRIAKYNTSVDYEKYVATIIYIPIILGLIFAIPLNIVLIFTHEVLSMNTELWNYMIVTGAAAALANVICGKLIIDGKYKLYAFYSILLTLMNVGLSILLCYTAFTDEKVYMARVIGGFTAQVFAAILLLVLSKTVRKVDFKYVKQALIWGFPLLLHTLATVVLTQTDKIAIQYMDSYSSVGIYGVAVTLVAIPLVVYTSFESAWAPWFYKKLNQEDYGSIKSFNNVYILAMCFVVCIFMLASPTLIKLFTNKDYWDAMYSLIPLSASVFFETLYGISVSVEYYHKKTWMITLGTTITVLINIGLDILFVYLWGYIAAAYATVLSKALLFLFHLFISRKIDNHSMFSLLFAFILTLFMAGIVTVSIVLANVFWARLVIAIAILVLLVLWIYKNKTLFINVFKSKREKSEENLEEKQCEE